MTWHSLLPRLARRQQIDPSGRVDSQEPLIAEVDIDEFLALCA